MFAFNNEIFPLVIFIYLVVNGPLKKNPVILDQFIWNYLDWKKKSITKREHLRLVIYERKSKLSLTFKPIFHSLKLWCPFTILDETRSLIFYVYSQV